MFTALSIFYVKLIHH